MINGGIRVSNSFVLQIGIILATVILQCSIPLYAKGLHVDEVYDPARILRVEITLPPSDWDQIRRQVRTMPQALGEARKTGEATSPFSWVDAHVEINGIAFEDASIRKKGFIGSLDSDRPSLKVRLPKSGAAPENGIVHQLTLNNNKQDRALVSQTMAYSLFNQAGLVAPRTSYATVSVNGKALGVYTNVEPARQPLVQRGFGTDKGTLYEGTIVDFYQGWKTGFERKFGPDEAGREKIGQLIDALDSDDNTLVAAVGEVVDLDHFLRFWALESLIGFWDGYTGNQNNYFCYHNPKTDRLYFLPWGADSVFTSRGMMDRGGPRSVKARGRLAGKLYQVPEIRARYRRIMLDLLESHWNEEQLAKESERVEALVSNQLHPKQEEGFQRSIDRTRDFFSSRREELMAELEHGAPEVENGSSEPMYFTTTGRIEGEISGTWHTDGPDDASSVGTAEVKVFLEGEEVEFEKLGAHAIQGRFGFRGPGQPNLNIVGKRTSDGETVTLMIMVDEDSFRPADAPVNMGGMMREGQGFGFGPGSMKPIDGKIQFSAAAREEGAPFKAKLSGQIMKMVGDFFGRRGKSQPRIRR